MAVRLIHSLVGIGIGTIVAHAAHVFGVDYHLAIVVASVGSVFLVPHLVISQFPAHTQLCTCHRHARGAVEHGEAHLMVWQRLVHHAEVGHAQQQTLGAHRHIIGRKLHHIDAYGQRSNLHRVARHPVGRHADVATCLCLRHVRGEMRLQFVIFFFRRGVEVGVATYVYATHGHRQLAYVAHAEQVHLALCARHHHAVADRHVKARKRETALCVAQNVHSRPCTPVYESVVDERHLVLCVHIFSLTHYTVTLYRHLTCHLQVLILVEQRIYRQQILRLAQLCQGSRLALLQQFQRRKT